MAELTTAGLTRMRRGECNVREYVHDSMEVRDRDVPDDELLTEALVAPVEAARVMLALVLRDGTPLWLLARTTVAAFMCVLVVVDSPLQVLGTSIGAFIAWVVSVGGLLGMTEGRATGEGTCERDKYCKEQNRYGFVH